MMSDTRSDPVALFKDAFGPDSTGTRRDAALGLMMQNPQGFVSGLADVLGSFSSAQFLTRMIEDASAPEPLRKAAENELARLESRSLENKRLDTQRTEYLQIGWGESSFSNSRPAVPPAKPELPDAEMRKKYRETVVRPSYAPVTARKNFVVTGLMLFSLVRTGRS